MILQLVLVLCSVILFRIIYIYRQLHRGRRKVNDKIEEAMVDSNFRYSHYRQQNYAFDKELLSCSVIVMGSGKQY